MKKTTYGDIQSLLKNVSFDKRQRNYCIVDTETIGITNPRVYDLSLVIFNKNKTLFKIAFVIDEVFNSKLWDSAYYSNKRNKYVELLDTDQDYHLANFWEVEKCFNNILKHFNVKHLGAYNVNFDLRALKFSNKQYKYSKNEDFIEKLHQLEIFDIWTMACNKANSDYVNYCIENGFLSKSGNPQTNAEIMYSYYTKNPDFKECHIGLSDCLIEMEIFKQIAFNGKKKIGKLEQQQGNCWKVVAKIKKEMEKEEE